MCPLQFARTLTLPNTINLHPYMLSRLPRFSLILELLDIFSFPNVPVVIIEPETCFDPHQYLQDPSC